MIKNIFPATGLTGLHESQPQPVMGVISRATLLYCIVIFSWILTINLGCFNQADSSQQQQINRGVILEKCINGLGSSELGIRLDCLDMLTTYGSESLPYLREALYSSDLNIHYYSLRALGDIGPESLDILIEFHKQGNAFSESEVSSLLFNASWENPLPKIYELFWKESDPKTRLYIFTIIAIFSKDTGDSIPFLFQVLEEEESIYKFGAGEVLALLAKEEKDYSDEIISGLSKKLTEGDDEIRIATISSLCNIGPNAIMVSDNIYALFETDQCGGEAFIYVSALNAIDPGKLYNIGDEVLECVNSDSVEVKINAIRTLSYLSKQLDVIPVLLNETNNDNSEVRYEAAMALCKIGSNSDKRPLEAVINVLESESNGYYRAMILESIANFGKSEDVLLVFRNSLKDKVSVVRVIAGKEIIQYGNSASSAIQELVDVLYEEMALLYPEYVGLETYVYPKYFAIALGEIGCEAEIAIPALQDMLSRKDGELKVAAAVAIYKINNSKIDIIHYLKEALYDVDLSTRFAAATALGELGSAAEYALDDLKEVAEVNRMKHICINYIEEAAIKAIEKIEAEL